ncbi:type II toxin-antitoxin system RelE/ParE family toxin [Novosphingobium sp. Chol11]|uniref:type II toxin-antitoxin system RelE/ParE family toxin n=1 Tax=Novosphingobium sp. Chol11 TaxID=1385763 RepID=UPI0025D6473E|nr:type II toxin-antitoxin system RelE/ParE family toxin [Novosphingobium sp. Chol11]
MRRVEWTRSALADIIAQAEHIARNNLDSAQRVAAAIREAGNALGTFATGRPGRVAGIYEKSVRRLPYIIAYAMTDADQAVSILRVIHTARDWPEGDWPRES